MTSLFKKVSFKSALFKSNRIQYKTEILHSTVINVLQPLSQSLSLECPTQFCAISQLGPAGCQVIDTYRSWMATLTPVLPTFTSGRVRPLWPGPSTPSHYHRVVKSYVWHTLPWGVLSHPRCECKWPHAPEGRCAPNTRPRLYRQHIPDKYGF